MFILLPLCAVYYPVAVLPPWVAAISWCLPPTYVFEGMRALLLHHAFRGDLMIEAFGINLVYLAAAGFTFRWLLERARIAGTLLSDGE
jgi:ABC-2 type transport system permease protein